LSRVTNGSLTNVNPSIDTLQRNMGAFIQTNLTVLTAHAELLTILLGNLQGAPNPSDFIKMLIRNLSKKEGNSKIKSELIELCNDSYGQD